MEPFRRVMRYEPDARSKPRLYGSPSSSAPGFPYAEVGLDMAKRGVSTSRVTPSVRR
jgi:hypothetical protein